MGCFEAVVSRRGAVRAEMCLLVVFSVSAPGLGRRAIFICSVILLQLHACMFGGRSERLVGVCGTAVMCVLRFGFRFIRRPALSWVVDVYALL